MTGMGTTTRAKAHPAADPTPAETFSVAPASEWVEAVRREAAQRPESQPQMLVHSTLIRSVGSAIVAPALVSRSGNDGGNG